MLRSSLCLFFVMAFSCAAQECPLQFVKTKTNVLLPSVLGRPYFFELLTQIKNVSGKEIRGMKLIAAYFDVVEDLHLFEVLAYGKPVPNGKEIKADFELGDISLLPKDSKGWIVIPAKILFADGSVWQEPLKTPGCWGEFWRDKTHARLTKLPSEALADLDKFEGKETKVKPAKNPLDSSKNIRMHNVQNGFLERETCTTPAQHLGLDFAHYHQTLLVLRVRPAGHGGRWPDNVRLG